MPSLERKANKGRNTFHNSEFDISQSMLRFSCFSSERDYLPLQHFKILAVYSPSTKGLIISYPNVIY